MIRAKTTEYVSMQAKMTTSVPVQKVSAAMTAKLRINQKTRVTLVYLTSVETERLANQRWKKMVKITNGGANARPGGKVSTVWNRSLTTCVIARMAGLVSFVRNRLLMIALAVKKTIPVIMVGFAGLRSWWLFVTAHSAGLAPTVTKKSAIFVTRALAKTRESVTLARILLAAFARQASPEECAKLKSMLGVL
jgi:hypothetical protein